METIKRMRARHEKEIDDFQSRCKHRKLSEWVPSMWAPGHQSGEVKYCLKCDKKIEHKFESPTFTTTSGVTDVWVNSDNTTYAYSGGYNFPIKI